MIGRVFRHSTVYLIAVVLQRSLPLVLLPIVANGLSDVSIGAIGLAAIVAGGVSLIATFGLNVAALRYGADGSAESRSRWSSLFVVQIGWSVVVGLAFTALASVWLPWDNADGGQRLVFAAIGLGLGQSWLQMAMTVFRTRQQPARYLALAAAVFLVSFAAAMFLAQDYGAAGYIWGLAIGASVPAVVGIAVSISRPSLDRAFLAAAVLLAAPFMVHWAGTWALVGFDRFLIERSLGLAAVGVFYVAFVYAAVPLLVAESFGTAWLPAYLTGDVDTRSLGRLTAVVSLGVAGLVLTGLGLAIVVMPVLYGGLDPVVLPLLGIIAPVAIMRVPHIVATAPIVRAHRTAVLGVSSVVAAALNVLIVIAVVGSAGLIGVAWAKVAAFAVASLWVWLTVMPRAAWSVGLITVASAAGVSWVSSALMSGVGQRGIAMPVAALFAFAGAIAIAATLRYFVVHFGVSEVEAQGMGTVK